MWFETTVALRRLNPVKQKGPWVSEASKWISGKPAQGVLIVGQVCGGLERDPAPPSGGPHPEGPHKTPEPSAET